MLDAIIIAGLRSWRRVEREREREMGVVFFGNGIFILKSVDFSWNLHRNLYSKPLGDGQIFVYIYSNDYWRFVTLIFVVTVEF